MLGNKPILLVKHQDRSGSKKFHILILVYFLMVMRLHGIDDSQTDTSSIVISIIAMVMLLVLFLFAWITGMTGLPLILLLLLGPFLVIIIIFCLLWEKTLENLNRITYLIIIPRKQQLLLTLTSMSLPEFY